MQNRQKLGFVNFYQLFFEYSRTSTGLITPVITYYDAALYTSPVPGKTHNKNLLIQPWFHGWL